MMRRPLDGRPYQLFYKIVKIGALVFGGLIIGGSLVLLAGKALWDSRFYDNYDPALPLNCEVVETRPVAEGLRQKLIIRLAGQKGVPVLFQYPKPTGRKVPCLVLLYGIGQKMSFLDEIAGMYNRAGIGLICHEQYGQGERKNEAVKSGWQGLLSLRRRAGFNATEIRRIVDYLQTRAEVDPQRIFFFGISFGAITGVAPLAMDPRFHAGILMWGGGDIPALLGPRGESQNPGKTKQNRWLAWATASLLSPVEPLDWIQRISPRPLLFQNALADEIIPRACTDAYFSKAAQPKKILWYACGHEKGLSKELIHQIIQDQIVWIHSLISE